MSLDFRLLFAFNEEVPLGVLACAKHYVGDGGTTFGSAKTGLDQGDTRVDEATLRRVHLPG